MYVNKPVSEGKGCNFEHNNSSRKLTTRVHSGQNIYFKNCIVESSDELYIVSSR